MTLHESIGHPEEVNAGLCRFCKTPLLDRFIDVSLSFGKKHLNPAKPAEQAFLPTYVCAQCFLIQVPEHAQLTPDGPFYASSFSSSWLDESKQFSDKVFSKLEITDHGLAVELTPRHDELSCRLSFQRGLSSFIDTYGKANLIITHDELTHIPDINGFLSAVKLFLNTNGVITFEFLHVVQFMEGANLELPRGRYFPYFSLATWDRMLMKYGMSVFEVEACQPKGSLRIYAKHAANPVKRISDQVRLLRGSECDKGICSLNMYREYKSKSERDSQSRFLINKVEPAFAIDHEQRIQA